MILKKKKRGYNQLTEFGKSLSKVYNVPYIEDLLFKISKSKTQTSKKRLELFSKLKTKFLIKKNHNFNNKHLLLIDDVITTGATIESYVNTLIKLKNTTISIATIAYTSKI